MRDPNDNDDSIDRAYRAAVAAADDADAVQRRRAAVLQAVGGPGRANAAQRDRHADGSAARSPGERPAANEARWQPSAAWWRGVAAACVLVTSGLLVMNLRQEPGVATAPGRTSDALRQTPAAPANPTALSEQAAQAKQAAKSAQALAADETTTGAATQAAPRQAPAAHAAAPAPATPATLPAPAPATVNAAGPSATVPTATTPAQAAPLAQAPAQAAPLAQPPPAARAERSALPGQDGGVPSPTGRVLGAVADTAPVDPLTRPAAVAPPMRTAVPAADEAERQGPPVWRTEQAPPPEKPVRAATASPPPAAPTARAAAAAEKTAPPVGHGPRLARGVVPAAGNSLLAAVGSGDAAAVHQILQTADPDAERDADGRTALAIAVLRADVPVVKLLLASRASRYAPDRFGQTPQDHAQTSGNPALQQAFTQP